MNKCKTCGKNCDGEYCFIHKLKKGFVKKSTPIRKTVELKSKTLQKMSEKEEQIDKMREFFLTIWRVRLHYSQVSMDYLGKEPLHVFFHHILPKEKYPEAAFDKENIILLTIDEHSNVESDMYKYEEINRRREILKKKYNV